MFFTSPSCFIPTLKGRVLMNEVGTLKKGLDILWLVIERGNLSVLEIMDILQYNRSTTYRLVNTLEKNGFIQKTTETTYEASSELVEKLLGSNSSMDFELKLGIAHAADEFKELTKETIFVGALKGSQVFATHVIPGSYPTRTHYEIGEKLPAYLSAAGKCILAFQSPNVWAVYKKKFTSELQSNSELFFKELEQVKEVGYAIDNEDAEAGVRCVAAPIWKDGSVIAAIAITGPSVRMSKEMDEENSKIVKQFSRKISESLDGGMTNAK